MLVYMSRSSVSFANEPLIVTSGGLKKMPLEGTYSRLVSWQSAPGSN